MLKHTLPAILVVLMACGGAQTSSEAHAARHTDQAEANVVEQEQDVDDAEDEVDDAEAVEGIIQDNDDQNVQEAADIIEAS